MRIISTPSTLIRSSVRPASREKKIASKPPRGEDRPESPYNLIRAKRGEGDREEIEQTDWTPGQRAALATGLNRGSSVEEIARAVGKSIPETYAKIREKPVRRAA